MGRKKSARAVFTLVIDQDAARVRKTFAPACRPQEDKRRKQPRRRPDHLAETAEPRPE